MDAQGLSAAIAAHFAGMAARDLLHETRADEPEVVAVRIESKIGGAHGATVTEFEFLNRSGLAIGGGTL